MDNFGLWAALSLPLFFALTNRLKGLSQDIALWIYFWGIGALWSVKLWQLHQLYLSAQQMDLGPRGTEQQSEMLHILCVSAAAMAFMLALPPFWYLRDKRKTRTQATE